MPMPSCPAGQSGILHRHLPDRLTYLAALIGPVLAAVVGVVAAYFHVGKIFFMARAWISRRQRRAQTQRAFKGPRRAYSLLILNSYRVLRFACSLSFFEWNRNQKPGEGFMKREHQRDRGSETHQKSRAASVKLGAADASSTMTASSSNSTSSSSTWRAPGQPGGAATGSAGVNPPRPQWARYVDSRLKQFCAR
jgi:hypothetical protein